MEKKNSTDGLHAGHRARMRQRFAETGGKGMADHELLELLLYYCIPRQDTNDLAHRLMESFGSLSGILEADPDLVATTLGAGASVATFLSLLGETAARYVKEKLQGGDRKTVYDTPEKIVTYLASVYMGIDVERVYLLLFDNGMHLLDCYHVCDGSVTGVSMSIRRMTERAYRKGAAVAVLAHNHPGGNASPSFEDIRLTQRLDEAMRLLEIPLLEHYVIAGRTYSPILCRVRGESEEAHAAASTFAMMKQKFSAPKGLKED